MYNVINIKKKEKNIGIEILRVLLCFWVVISHIIKHSDSLIINLIIKKKFHVPCFFFISFYYFFPIIRYKNYSNMKTRLVRLFIPYIIWPLIIWLLNNLLYFMFDDNRFGRFLSFQELKLQLVTGRSFFIQLWYLFNLLFLMIFFFLFSFIPKYIFFISILLIGIKCYYIQYFKYNNFYFNEYKDSISHSVGHFISSFPISIWAFFCNLINLIQFMEKYRYIYLYFIIILIVIFLVGSSNTYNGIDKNLFSVFTFLCFYLFPFDKYLNNKLKNIINKLTSYTNGIYCLHIIIKFHFFKYLKISKTIISCLEIYIICYIISFIGEKIFRKNKFKYLFI